MERRSVRARRARPLGQRRIGRRAVGARPAVQRRIGLRLRRAVVLEGLARRRRRRARLLVLQALRSSAVAGHAAMRARRHRVAIHRLRRGV